MFLLTLVAHEGAIIGKEGGHWEMRAWTRVGVALARERKPLISCIVSFIVTNSFYFSGFAGDITEGEERGRFGLAQIEWGLRAGGLAAEVAFKATRVLGKNKN